MDVVVLIRASTNAGICQRIVGGGVVTPKHASSPSFALGVTDLRYRLLHRRTSIFPQCYDASIEAGVSWV